MAHALNHAGIRTTASDDGFMARIRKSIADYRVYAATLNELSQLSDRDLADLGLHRSMIRDIARDSVYQA